MNTPHTKNMCNSKKRVEFPLRVENVYLLNHWINFYKNLHFLSEKLAKKSHKILAQIFWITTKILNFIHVTEISCRMELHISKTEIGYVIHFFFHFPLCYPFFDSYTFHYNDNFSFHDFIFCCWNEKVLWNISFSITIRIEEGPLMSHYDWLFSCKKPFCRKLKINKTFNIFQWNCVNEILKNKSWRKMSCFPKCKKCQSKKFEMKCCLFRLIIFLMIFWMKNFLCFWESRERKDFRIIFRNTE
jgi:hypothetical protein